MNEAGAKLFKELSEPMPYKWRLKQVANKAKRPYPEGTRGQFLAYIDARDVFNRLDKAVGLGNWQDSVKRVNEDGSVIVALSVKVGVEWITKEDCGYPNNPGSDIEDEPLKAAVSDGIKRAGVHFGIGRFLYELPPVWTAIDANGQPLKPINNQSAATHPSAPRDANDDVDHETGELNSSARHPDAPAQPAPDGPEFENQPCAIEGCKGICIGSWVAFSLRRYGVPLCSRHSAMAKKGELESELQRLNHAS